MTEKTNREIRRIHITLSKSMYLQKAQFTPTKVVIIKDFNTSTTTNTSHTIIKKVSILKQARLKVLYLTFVDIGE
jgi:hypothetical protein